MIASCQDSGQPSLAACLSLPCRRFYADTAAVIHSYYCTSSLLGCHLYGETFTYLMIKLFFCTPCIQLIVLFVCEQLVL